MIARGRRWYEQLTSGEMPTLRAIAKAENLDERLRRACSSKLTSGAGHHREGRAGSPAIPIHGEIPKAPAAAGVGRAASALRHAALSRYCRSLHSQLALSCVPG